MKQMFEDKEKKSEKKITELLASIKIIKMLSENIEE